MKIKSLLIVLVILSLSTLFIYSEKTTSFSKIMQDSASTLQQSQQQIEPLNTLSLIQEESWMVTYTTDEDFFFYAKDKNKRQTEVCLLSKTATKTGDLDQHKNLYSKNKTLVESLNRKKVAQGDSGLDKDYYGYCRNILTESYIKFGENSTVAEFQNESRIEYITDFGANANVTVLENSSEGYVINFAEVWIKDKEGKFGANHSGMNETEVRSFQYKVETDYEIIPNGNKPYIYRNLYKGTPRQRVQERHLFDFTDICTRNFTDNSTSDCEFSYDKVVASNESYYDAEMDETNYVVTYTYLLNVTFNSDWFIDPTISINEFSVSESLDTNVTQENNFTHLTISDVAPYDSLVLYMPFDVENKSDGIMYDWSKEGNDGTINGDALFNASGLYGGVMDFDGSGDYVDVTTVLDSMRPLNANKSMSIWVKLDSSALTDGVTHSIFEMGRSDDTDTLIALRKKTDDSIVFRIRESSVNKEVQISDISDFDNWHHLVAVWNDTNMSLYDNTVLVGTNINTGIGGASYDQVFIGADAQEVIDFYMNGSVDEVMVFNTSLTAQQIIDLYNNQSVRFKTPGTQELKQFNITAGNNTVNVSTNSFQKLLGSNLELRLGEWDISRGYNDTEDGTGYTLDDGLVGYWHFDNQSSFGENATHVHDFSGEGNNGTLRDGVFINSSGFYENAADFNSDNNNVKINDYLLNNSNQYAEYTLSAWINARTWGESGFGRIYDETYPGVNGISFFIRDTSDNVRAIHSGASDSAYESSANTLTLNTWHHVTAVYDGSRGWIYVDGVDETDDSSIDSPIAQIGANLGKTQLGIRNQGNDREFDGLIDEMMVYNRSLSADEIKSLYIKGKANWDYSSYQDVVEPYNTYPISSASTNILPDYRFSAGNSTNPFYSPILEAGMTFDFYTSEAGPSDNSPTVTLLSPSNATSSDTISEYSFNSTITDDINIDNATLYIWFDNGTLYNTTEWLSISETTEYQANSTVNLDIYENYTWNYLAYDNASQSAWNSANWTIEYKEAVVPDTTPPNFQVANLSILTNETTSILLNLNATDSESSIDGFAINWTDTFAITYVDGNLSNVSAITQGEYWINASVNDTEGNYNYSLILINVTNAIVSDVTPPTVNIIYPTSTDYAISSLDLNYTSNEEGYCWYSKDSWATNSTPQATSINWSSISGSEGSNTWLVGCNDSSNNIGTDSITFTIDTTPPTLELANQSLFTNQTLALQINATDSGVGVDGFSINWTDTFSIDFTTGNITNISAIIEGEYWINVSANDTLNNIAYGLVLVNVTNSTEADTIFPDIQIVYPPNNTNTTDTQIDVNYTASDETAIDKCWWGNETTNTTITCGVNITDQIWNEGLNNITLYTNDTANNVNSSYVQFRVDTTPPTFSPALSTQTITESQSLSYNLGAIDSGVGLSGFTINDTYSLFSINFVTGVLTNTSSLVGQDAEYHFNVSINDSLDNKYSEILLVNVTSIDSTPPELKINFPTNNTITSNSNLHVNYTATDNIGLDECWYSNDSMMVNYSLTDCSTNITTITWSEGLHNVTIFTNDTSGNENQSLPIFFTIDTILPNLEILFPAINNTNTTDTGYDVNYTFSDTNMDKCWWSVNDGANTTITCGVNITGETWAEGLNKVIVYANDTVNNVNNSEITFRLDTTAPTIIYDNVTFVEGTSLDFNINATDSGVGVDGYVINWTTTFAITYVDGNLTNTSAILEGEYWINISVNDTLDNTNEVTMLVNVTAPVDIIPPNINITYPTNNTITADIQIDINYTFSDDNVDTCWWSNETTNTTISCGVNITDQIWNEGLNNITLYANDTSNNVNSSYVQFRVDTLPPYFNHQLETQTIPENQDLSYDINATDTGIGIDIYSINSTYSLFTIGSLNGKISNSSSLVGQTGEYYFNVSVNDFQGNTNTSILFVNVTPVDSIPPNINITSPQNTTYINGLIDINYTASDETSLGYCWYSNDSGVTNSSIQTCSTNWTVTYLAGSHNIIVYVNDTQGNQNSSNITFFVDLTPPNIQIITPTNNSNTTNTGLHVNYTHSNVNEDTCWWTEDAGVNNNTLASCGTNITDQTWNEGLNNIIIFINDTGNNINSSFVRFRLDTTPPSFTNLVNQSFNNNSAFSYDINANDVGVGISIWNISDTTNFTINSLTGVVTNKTSLSIGYYELFVSVNDTLGNTNTSLWSVNATNVTVETTPEIIRGGRRSTRLPIKVDVIAPTIWYRGREIVTELQAFNGINELYEPNNITFKYEIEGMELINSRIDADKKIYSTFKLSADVELGEKEMLVIVDDQRRFIKEVKFQVKEQELSILKSYLKERDNLIIILIVSIVVILLFGCFMLLLVLERKSKKERFIYE
jgi:hypothetical protein